MAQPKCREYGRGLPKAMCVFRDDIGNMVYAFCFVLIILCKGVF